MSDLNASTSVAALAVPDPATTAAPVAEVERKPGRVFLDYPFERAGQTIAFVDVRRPKSGELRHLNLNALINSGYNELETVLPRITTPRLTKEDVANLDPADLTQLAGEVMDFLLPKAAKQAFPQS